uniref:Putative micronuclear linker histone polyprotein-like n=1 Tax=Solanum chacoense TaxID=4108 RepID=A0A0V0IUF6_SOLCH
MAGDIEEPFRHSFQADSWQSGSISFGRFENESLCWERRSSFTHNRYLEEVEKYSKPGSVTEKKAYFEARLRKKALLRQSSSEWQNGTESQVSENDGHENTSYEGDFEHVNEIGHSARFVENHDGSANLLENEKYSENDVTENEGYAGDFEHANEDGHSAHFDENIDRSIHLLKNGKYQAENTGYDGDFERVNEVVHSSRFEESLDGSHNGDIKVTECGGEDSIILHSGPQIEQATNSSDVLQSVPEHMEAEANFHLNAGNSAFDDDPKTEIEVKVKLEVQDSSMEFSSNSIDLSSNAHTTEKDGSVSSEPQRSSSSKVRTASQSRDTKARMLSQVSVASGKGTISKQAYKDMPSKPNRRHSDVSLTRKGENPRLNAPAALLRPTAKMPKPEACSGSKANVLNQQKSTEQQPKARKTATSRASCTEKVSHIVHQSINRDKQSVSSCQPGMKQNGSGFLFKSEERAKKRKEFLMKLEEKMHAVEAEKHQLQARTQVKKEAELKQLRRNLNFKATPMPAFYHEPGRRSDRNKELASKTKSSKSQSRPSTSGARAISATENTVPCSTSEHINMADSPQVSEVTNHPSAELSDSSVPSSAPTNKTSWQTRSNRTVAPKREQEKRQVLNSPRPRTADTNKGNKGFKAEEKTKVVARRSIGNNAMRKDIRSIDLSRSTRVGRLAVGVAS